jgi:hypothetical protein
MLTAAALGCITASALTFMTPRTVFAFDVLQFVVEKDPAALQRLLLLKVYRALGRYPFPILWFAHGPPEGY